MPTPPHIPTAEQRRQVELGASFGLSQRQIAELVGVTQGTLRRRYRRELEAGAAKVHVEALSQLVRLSKAGSLGATEALLRRFDPSWEKEFRPLGPGVPASPTGDAALPMLNLHVMPDQAAALGASGDRFDQQAEPGAAVLPPRPGRAFEPDCGPNEPEDA